MTCNYFSIHNYKLYLIGFSKIAYKYTPLIDLVWIRCNNFFKSNFEKSIKKHQVKQFSQQQSCNYSRNACF